MKGAARKLFKELNAELFDLGGFEMLDDSATSEAEVLDIADAHVRWFRLHMEAMAQKMDREISKRRRRLAGEDPDEENDQ